MSSPQESRKRPFTLTVLQIILLGALLVTTMGASGIFAFVLCPGCGTPMTYHAEPLSPTAPLPEALEKDSQETK